MVPAEDTYWLLPVVKLCIIFQPVYLFRLRIWRADNLRFEKRGHKEQNNVINRDLESYEIMRILENVPISRWPFQALSFWDQMWEPADSWASVNVCQEIHYCIMTKGSHHHGLCTEVQMHCVMLSWSAGWQVPTAIMCHVSTFAFPPFFLPSCL